MKNGRKSMVGKNAIKPFLNQFEERMKVIAIVDFIVNRTGKKEKLEDKFDNEDMTNLIFTTLLFIMDESLEESNECDMLSIEVFLEEHVMEYYKLVLNQEEVKELADYIITVILRNNGRGAGTYRTKNYNENKDVIISIKLIATKTVKLNDGTEKEIFSLTREGYDFLFRTKEMEDELQLTIEQLKIKKLIEERRFNTAARNSMDIIRFVRQSTNDIENLTLEIKRNILNTDYTKYRKVVDETYRIVFKELEELGHFMDFLEMVAKEYDDSGLESSHEMTEENVISARKDIREIQKNISIAINEMGYLAEKRMDLSDIYTEKLKAGMILNNKRKYNFEDDLLKRVEEDCKNLEACVLLLRPLFGFVPDKHMSLEHIYAPQPIVCDKEKEQETILDDETKSDEEENRRIQEITQKYDEIVSMFIKGAIDSENKRVYLSEIIEMIKKEDLERYLELTKNKELFTVPLQLYRIDENKLNLKEFYKSKGKLITNPSENFDLDATLTRIGNNIAGIKEIEQIKIRKSDNVIIETMEYIEDEIKIKKEFEMNDVYFEVAGV
jgi:hypothetical protein